METPIRGTARCKAWGIPLPFGGFLTQFPVSAIVWHQPESPTQMRLLFPLIACVALSACLTSPKECQDIPSDPAAEQFDPSLGAGQESGQISLQIGA